MTSHKPRPESEWLNFGRYEIHLVNGRVSLNVEGYLSRSQQIGIAPVKNDLNIHTSARGVTANSTSKENYQLLYELLARVLDVHSKYIGIDINRTELSPDAIKANNPDLVQRIVSDARAHKID